MKDILKRALSLANKDGKEFIKRWVMGFGVHLDCKVIGIENLDYASSWFLLVFEYMDHGVRAVRFASISTWWSGGAKSTYYGDCYHAARMHAENRMQRLFKSRYAHHNTGSFQCYRAKAMELNRKYQYEPRYKW